MPRLNTQGRSPQCGSTYLRPLRRNSTWRTPDIFGEVARDTERRAGHHRMLQSYARHDYTHICKALDLSGEEHVIDAGGGLGALAQIIVQTHPSTKVSVLERPEVVAMAPDLAPMVRWHRGDLLEPWPLNGDAVILARVLHDWDDAEARLILTHARAALPRGGHLYLVEMLIAERGVAGSLCDLHLLTVTGGRERSLKHFNQLLLSTGFDLRGVRRLPDLPSVIVGVAS